MNTATFVKYLMPVHEGGIVLAILTTFSDIQIEVKGYTNTLTKNLVDIALSRSNVDGTDIKSIYITQFCEIIDNDAFFDSVGGENNFGFVRELIFGDSDKLP